MRSIYIGRFSVDDLGDVAGGGEEDVLSNIVRDTVFRRMFTEKSLWLLANPTGIKVYANEIGDMPETAWGEVEDIAWLLEAAYLRLLRENEEFADELADLMAQYGCGIVEPGEEDENE